MILAVMLLVALALAFLLVRLVRVVRDIRVLRRKRAAAVADVDRLTVVLDRLTRESVERAQRPVVAVSAPMVVSKAVRRAYLAVLGARSPDGASHLAVNLYEGRGVA